MDWLSLLRLMNVGGQNGMQRPPPITMDGPGTGGISGRDPSLMNPPMNSPVMSGGYGGFGDVASSPNPIGGLPQTPPLQSIQQPPMSVPNVKSSMSSSSDDTSDDDDGEPSHVMSDQYQAALSQMPIRTDPTGIRRIGAIMAGAGASGGPMGIANGQVVGYRMTPGGFERGYEDAAYGDYDRQMADWQARTKALGQGATEEDRRESTRLLRKIQQQNADTRAQQADIAQQNADTKAAQLAVNKFKAEHHNWVLKDDGGILVAVDPQNPGSPAVTIKDANGNYVQTGKLDEMTRMYIQLGNQLALGQQRIQGQKDVEGVRESDRQKDITARGEEARKTKQTVPGKAAGDAKTLTPGQQHQARMNKIQDMLIEHPEWAPYVTFGNNQNGIPTGQFRTGVPQGGDDGTYHQVNDYIYGSKDIQLPSESDSEEPTPAPTQTPPTTRKMGPKVPTTETPHGKDDTDVVRVQPKGNKDPKKVFTIPRSNLPRLNTDNYEVVQQ